MDGEKKDACTASYDFDRESRANEPAISTGAPDISHFGSGLDFSCFVGATLYPGNPARSMACYTNPEDLASSINSLK